MRKCQIYGLLAAMTAAAAAVADNAEPTELTEVIVTAQKYEQKLQDVPMSLSVIDTQTLAENNQLRLADYYTSVPALNVAPIGQWGQNISIRGIANTGSATYAAAATTGILVDDLPFFPGFMFVPDLDPGDLQRIEVLRGPQGTLYGSNTLGGLVKFVTIDPSTKALTGRVEAGADTVYDGVGPGYIVRGLVNVPITGDLAIRLSAFTHEEPGYLDNPILGIDGINVSHTYGGRFALLWRPSEAFSLKFSAIYQGASGTSTDDMMTNEVITGKAMPLGDLQQGYPAGTQSYHNTLQSYGLTLQYKVDNFEFASITGYSVSKRAAIEDNTQYAGSISESVFGPNYTGYVFDEHYADDTLSQELRASGSLGHMFDGTIGFYWQGEPYRDFPKATYTTFTQLSTNTYTGQVGGSLYSTYTPPGEPEPAMLSDETALFANVTAHLTDKFDFELGARQTRLRQFEAPTGGIIGPGCEILVGVASPCLFPSSPDTEQKPFTYLIAPEYKFSQDFMIYGRIATGFRAGGSNCCPLLPGIPPTYGPDKTTNYEVGTKADVLDHKLSFDASVYYIDWDAIQLGLITPDGEGYTANAGGAKSEGVELNVSAAPIQGLKVAAWLAYDEAVITTIPPPQSVSSFYAVPGNPLPFTPKWSGRISIDQDIPLNGSMTGFVGGALAYIGDRTSYFTATPTRSDLPPYAKLDLHAGVNYQLWKLNVYANNVTDRRGLLSGGLGSYNSSYSYFIIQPLTVGFTIIRTFE